LSNSGLEKKKVRKHGRREALIGPTRLDAEKGEMREQDCGGRKWRRREDRDITQPRRDNRYEGKRGVKLHPKK